jgi:hypothetical protein
MRAGNGFDQVALTLNEFDQVALTLVVTRFPRFQPNRQYKSAQILLHFSVVTHKKQVAGVPATCFLWRFSGMGVRSDGVRKIASTLKRNGMTTHGSSDRLRFMISISHIGVPG